MVTMEAYLRRNIKIVLAIVVILLVILSAAVLDNNISRNTSKRVLKVGLSSASEDCAHKNGIQNCMRLSGYVGDSFDCGVNTCWYVHVNSHKGYSKAVEVSDSGKSIHSVNIYSENN